jgi:hypothetical protein
MDVSMKNEFFFFYVSKYMTNLFIHPYFMQLLKKRDSKCVFFPKLDGRPSILQKKKKGKMLDDRIFYYGKAFLSLFFLSFFFFFFGGGELVKL